MTLTENNEDGDKPTVIFSLPRSFVTGGVTSWTGRICNALHHTGRNVKIVNHRPVDGTVFSTPEWIKQLVLEAPPALSPYFLPSTRVLFSHHFSESSQPIVLIPNYGFETLGLAAMLTRHHNTRVLGFCHSDEPYYYKPLAKYEHIIHRFIAVSEECRRRLEEILPHRKEHIILRPYGVDVPQHTTRTARRPEQPIRLLYAGRVTEQQKRVSDLPRLAEILSELHVNYELTVLGDGDAKSTLIRRVAESSQDVQRRVQFLDRVPPEKVSRILDETDVSVLVSDYEGTSIFMLESIAHGVVPVVTDVSGVKAVVDQGLNGFAHPVGRLDLMAESIQRLDDDRTLLSQLSSNARHAAEPYSFPAYAKWFIRLVDEVAAEPPRQWPRAKPCLPIRFKALQALSPIWVPLRKIYRASIGKPVG